MGLLDGALAAVFGAAFAPLLRNGALHKMQDADLGTGGFNAVSTDYPVKLQVEQLASADRAASGVPTNAVKLTVLRAGLPVGLDLDDGLSVDGARYRIIRVDGDPAQAAFVVMAVPA